MKITHCAECNQEIDLDENAHSYCSLCNVDFCCGMFKTCFDEYHKKRSLYKNHNCNTIANPSWMINLKIEKN